MQREPEIENLLNAAVDAAVDAHLGLKAEKRTFDSMASHAKIVVLAQVEAGMWAKWTVVDARDFADLRVEFSLNNTLTGVRCGADRPVRVRWDFSRTHLRYLETACG